MTVIFTGAAEEARGILKRIRLRGGGRNRIRVEWSRVLEPGTRQSRRGHTIARLLQIGGAVLIPNCLGRARIINESGVGGPGPGSFVGAS